MQCCTSMHWQDNALFECIRFKWILLNGWYWLRSFHNIILINMHCINQLKRALIHQFLSYNIFRNLFWFFLSFSTFYVLKTDFPFIFALFLYVISNGFFFRFLFFDSFLFAFRCREYFSTQPTSSIWWSYSIYSALLHAHTVKRVAHLTFKIQHRIRLRISCRVAQHTQSWNAVA